jgi:hypothetical protein
MNNLPETSSASRELADLGQRLVRFGYALQQDHTTVAELTDLAGACGIHLQLRAVAEQRSACVDASSYPGAASCV